MTQIAINERRIGQYLVTAPDGEVLDEIKVDNFDGTAMCIKEHKRFASLEDAMKYMRKKYGGAQP